MTQFDDSYEPSGIGKGKAALLAGVAAVVVGGATYFVQDGVRDGIENELNTRITSDSLTIQGLYADKSRLIDEKAKLQRNYRAEKDSLVEFYEDTVSVLHAEIRDKNIILGETVGHLSGQLELYAWENDSLKARVGMLDRANKRALSTIVAREKSLDSLEVVNDRNLMRAAEADGTLDSLRLDAMKGISLYADSVFSESQKDYRDSWAFTVRGVGVYGSDVGLLHVGKWLEQNGAARLAVEEFAAERARGNDVSFDTAYFGEKFKEFVGEKLWYPPEGITHNEAASGVRPKSQ